MGSSPTLDFLFLLSFLSFSYFTFSILNSMNCIKQTLALHISSLSPLSHYSHSLMQDSVLNRIARSAGLNMVIQVTSLLFLPIGSE